MPGLTDPGFDNPSGPSLESFSFTIDWGDGSPVDRGTASLYWSRSAEDVWNQIRAMQPWPTPYTFLHRAGQPPLVLCTV